LNGRQYYIVVLLKKIFWRPQEKQKPMKNFLFFFLRRRGIDR